MLSRRGWIFWSLTGLVVALLAAARYGYEQLPRLPDTPDAPVVGVPEGALDRSPQPAYTGPHPRVMERPNETFQFPIRIGETGPVEPLFAGPNSYPFYCGRNKETDLQPLVDNQDGHGVPVYALDDEGQRTEEIVGYSKDCAHETYAGYYYRSSLNGKFYPLEDLDRATDDIAKITVNGKEIDFVVRLETGTINRFFYAIAVLRGEGETLERPAGTHWNQRLIYQFRGGVGIGRRQGNIKHHDLLKRRADQLARGYAIVYSTANQTSNHYDIWLAEDSALRLKKQFSALYGQPLYTVGIGGSGGGIQQYLLAQNNPEVIDAAIPLYSYPDMVTQTIYVFDCEPLEYFFDVVDRDNPRWRKSSERSVVQGLSYNNDMGNRFTALENAAGYLSDKFDYPRQGSTECVNGWRGLVPLVNNPRFVHFARNYAKPVRRNTHWTHWEDLKRFYGVGEDGYANSTWDNEGVQYGLEALKAGELSVEKFIQLNASIGGWKPPTEQQGEKLWFMNGDLLPMELSLWSDHNMVKGSVDAPAPRSRANLDAIEGAYRSGHVFLGHAEIPIIDLRHYLDSELDMHHSLASFSSRLRIQRARGHADNHLIWMSHKDYNPLDDALATIDRWMLRIAANPENGIAGNKPMDAADQCFAGDGAIIARGSDVWDGAWNGRAQGACMQEYPSYRTPREVAGGPVEGDLFKCALQPVEDAVNSGVYGNVDLSNYLPNLKRIFPTGVCDYSRNGPGVPRVALIPTSGQVKVVGRGIPVDYRLSGGQQLVEDSGSVSGD
ncbi:DUF6351 family protein [Biformimicrobium ophioploci]|uniref:DUF6351 family protein n=1 Tax=Biformimicrobium ophioploci TaxID=3036711 RepID=A0ABQ6M322_9GAMM|nr:DUF6351 family protein [Microbulbifer sp. NKW57]GMG88728.1 DUF6351 family protein [Microbulbifer sp. NKW57]